MTTFRDQLGLALSTEDNRRYSRDSNPYRLGIMLGAADDCAAMIANGATREDAFADCFTPCREMHRVAKRLGLALDVDRGRWVAA